MKHVAALLFLLLMACFSAALYAPHRIFAFAEDDCPIETYDVVGRASGGVWCYVTINGE